MIVGHGGDSDLGLRAVRSHRRPGSRPLRACGAAAAAALALLLVGSITLCAMLGYLTPLPS